MRSRLNYITNWEEEAKLAHFRVAALAIRCHVTERQLRRYFQQEFRTSPNHWIMAKRLEPTKPRIEAGASIKEVAFDAGFRNQESFSRQFKRFFKINPSESQIKRGSG
jgi:AraC-like DNA-binding protein